MCCNVLPSNVQRFFIVYKIAYFKINNSDSSHLPPELELGVIPEDSECLDLTRPDSNEVLVKAPQGLKIMKFKSGDPWPFAVFKANFWKFDQYQQFTENLLVESSSCNSKKAEIEDGNTIDVD
jgi:hypothetical protein